MEQDDFELLGFFKTSGTRYAVYRDPDGVVTWPEAQAYARSIGGDLVVIGSEAENTFLELTVGRLDAAWQQVAVDRSAGPWIGAHIAEDGQYRWSTGELLGYDAWAEGEPNNYLEVERAAHLVSWTEVNQPRVVEWNDLPESGTWPPGPRNVNSFIVERPGAVSDEDGRICAYLYEAGLDRDGAIDLEGLNYWIAQRGAGMSFEEMSQYFLDSVEFRESFGDPDDMSDLELVEQLYRNVLDREGEQAGVDFWTEVVGRDDFDRDQLLLAFAVSNENKANSEFVETLQELPFDNWQFV